MIDKNVDVENLCVLFVMHENANFSMHFIFSTLIASPFRKSHLCTKE